MNNVSDLPVTPTTVIRRSVSRSREALTMTADTDREALARAVTYALSAHSKTWRDLTPLDIATTILASDWLAADRARVRREGHREGYETARADMISGAFVGGPTFEALRDSFTGQQIRKRALGEAVEAMCPEADERDAMCDDEFWHHVLSDDDPGAPGKDWTGEAFTEDPIILNATPCPECGEAGACDYDTEGRPLIHATEEAGQ